MAGESARESARRMREKAARLERAASLHEQGADGEEVTAKALMALPSEWVVLHDLRWPGRRFANIDHVVVGPGGVFVIDSKNWSGSVTLNGVVLRQNGRSREKTVASCADAGLAVAGLVPLYANYVHPVLCFVEQDSLSGWARDVMLCSPTNVVEMLTTRPRVFGPSHVQYVVHALQVSMPMASAPARPSRTRSAGPPKRAQAAGRDQFAKVPTRQPKRKSRSLRSGGFAKLAVGLALIGVVYTPQIREPLTGKLTELMKPDTTVTQCDQSGSSSAETCADEKPSLPRKKTKPRP